MGGLCFSTRACRCVLRLEQGGNGTGGLKAYAKVRSFAFGGGDGGTGWLWSPRAREAEAEKKVC